METLTIPFGEKKKKSSNVIMDLVKSFSDACQVLAIDPGHNLEIKSADPIMQKQMKAISAFAQLVIIAKALNEGWEPDWDNSNEYKYYPWFDMRSGLGFSYDDCDGWDSDTFVGSRLCFKSEALAEYAGKQFLELYKDMMVLTPSGK